MRPTMFECSGCGAVHTSALAASYCEDDHADDARMTRRVHAQDDWHRA